jgi:hypothetical protein
LLCGGYMLRSERNLIWRCRGHLPPKRRYKDIKLNVLNPPVYHRLGAFKRLTMLFFVWWQ